MARSHGIGVTELAYRFALSQSAVTTVVGGFSNLAQLDEVGGFADAPPLSGEILADLAKVTGGWPDVPADTGRS